MVFAFAFLPPSALLAGFGAPGKACYHNFIEFTSIHGNIEIKSGINYGEYSD
jgi:hypothetical protein